MLAEQPGLDEMTKQFAVGTFAVMVAFFACFFIWPIFQILQGGFFDQDGNFTLAFFIEVFQNPIYLEGLLNAFLLAILSTALSLLLALPLAFVFDRFAFPGKKLLGGLIILPIMLPPFVGAIGLRQLLGQFGMLNACLIDLGRTHQGGQDGRRDLRWRALETTGMLSRVQTRVFVFIIIGL